MANFRVCMYYLPTPVQLGPFTLSNQTIWARGLNTVRIGGKDYTPVAIDGNPRTALALEADVRKADANSMAFPFPISSIWKQGMVEDTAYNDALRASAQDTTDPKSAKDTTDPKSDVGTIWDNVPAPTNAPTQKAPVVDIKMIAKDMDSRALSVMGTGINALLKIGRVWQQLRSKYPASQIIAAYPIAKSPLSAMFTTHYDAIVNEVNFPDLPFQLQLQYIASRWVGGIADADDAAKSMLERLDTVEFLYKTLSESVGVNSLIQTRHRDDYLDAERLIEEEGKNIDWKTCVPSYIVSELQNFIRRRPVDPTKRYMGEVERWAEAQMLCLQLFETALGAGDPPVDDNGLWNTDFVAGYARLYLTADIEFMLPTYLHGYKQNSVINNVIEYIAHGPAAEITPHLLKLRTCFVRMVYPWSKTESDRPNEDFGYLVEVYDALFDGTLHKRIEARNNELRKVQVEDTGSMDKFYDFVADLRRKYPHARPLDRDVTQSQLALSELFKFVSDNYGSLDKAPDGLQAYFSSDRVLDEWGPMSAARVRGSEQFLDEECERIAWATATHVVDSVKVAETTNAIVTGTRIPEDVVNALRGRQNTIMLDCISLMRTYYGKIAGYERVDKSLRRFIANSATTDIVLSALFTRQLYNRVRAAVSDVSMQVLGLSADPSADMYEDLSALVYDFRKNVQLEISSAGKKTSCAYETICNQDAFPELFPIRAYNARDIFEKVALTIANKHKPSENKARAVSDLRYLARNLRRLVCTGIPYSEPLSDYADWCEANGQTALLEAANFLGSMTTERMATLKIEDLWGIKQNQEADADADAAIPESFTEEQAEEKSVEPVPGPDQDAKPEVIPIDDEEENEPRNINGQQELVFAPMPKLSAGRTYVSVKPQNPATGIDMSDNFAVGADKDFFVKLMMKGHQARGSREVDETIAIDIAVFSKHIGLKNKLPMRNIVILESDTQPSSLSTAMYGGKQISVLTLNPDEIVEIFGGYNTQSVLHVITHELAHYIYYQMKGTTLLKWRRATSGKQIHPAQYRHAGEDYYNEQFAILAECLVWGRSARGLFTEYGREIVEGYFVNNFMPKGE